MRRGDNFWDCVDVSGPDECWEWKLGRVSDGYGWVWVPEKKKQIGAHRYAYELANGIEPPGAVLHACDNPPCCNPAHLAAGTQTDNIRDMHSKGRAARRPGEANPNAKLNEAAVREIRRRVAAGEKQLPLAREFGVTHTLIRYIVTRRAWRHVA